jgi:hypothetical protein
MFPFFAPFRAVVRVVVRALVSAVVMALAAVLTKVAPLAELHGGVLVIAVVARLDTGLGLGWDGTLAAAISQREGEKLDFKLIGEMLIATIGFFCSVLRGEDPALSVAMTNAHSNRAELFDKCGLLLVQT